MFRPGATFGGHGHEGGHVRFDLDDVDRRTRWLQGSIVGLPGSHARFILDADRQTASAPLFSGFLFWPGAGTFVLTVEQRPAEGASGPSADVMVGCANRQANKLSRRFPTTLAHPFPIPLF